MRIEENKSLKNYNTFGIDARARYYTELTSIDDFREILSYKAFGGLEKFVLGGGSNILFTKSFDGLVIRNCLSGLEFSAPGEKTVTVKAGAGEIWHQVVLRCVEKNYAGIENLSLIPGCIGAAPIQNIGAYGVELKDVFEELEVLNMHTGERVKFGLNDCRFGYRESVFKNDLKGQFIITSVTLRLINLNIIGAIYRLKMDYGDVKATLNEMKAFEPGIKDVSDAVVKIRSSKLPDPAVIGNAGSFFKNPTVSKEQCENLISKYPLMPNYPQKDGQVKIAAGWLIEQCGWKGKIVGHTGAHKTQALVLVNYGGATGDEVYKLALDIQRSVKEKFGIELSFEVNLL